MVFLKRRFWIKIVLFVGVSSFLQSAGPTVPVYTIKPISNIINRRVIIQRIYYEQGRFAGHQLKQLIEAETIVLDQFETRGVP